MAATDVMEIVPIQTECFHAMPPAPRHAISTHLPGWDLMLEFIKKDPEFFAKFHDMYPRFVLHRDIKQLIGKLLQSINVEGAFCLPFPSLQIAKACVRFVTPAKRTDRLDSVPEDDISIKAYEVNGVGIWAVVFPMDQAKLVMPFWMNAGVGISSRLAEDALNHIGSLCELPADKVLKSEKSTANNALKERIAELMEQAPVGPPRSIKVAADDVHLFQSGMSVIYNVNNYLIEWRNNPKSKTVMFGTPFHQTIHIFEYWGPGVQFFPLGTELDELEKYLQDEENAGSRVQAVWTEFPSNPLLVSSDLTRLRELADRYRFVLVIDDTIGSFCNVDVLPVADIVVTSLTKSFSGYADVMGGSAVLNPDSILYSELKPLFNKLHFDNLYVRDSEVLLSNSKDYFTRSTVLNSNAAALATYLNSLVSDSTSSVTNVFYPTLSPTLSNYDEYKRPATSEFTPGYGCLFSVQLSTIEATKEFYNHLHVHHGPHLGAHRTLALPYVRALYGDELEKVKAWGLEETQIRISVGLEAEKVLLETFKHALKKADAVIKQDKK